MPDAKKPNVTGVVFQTDLLDGSKGLDTTDGSTSSIQIDGDALTEGDKVKVWNTAGGESSNPRWSGTLIYNPKNGNYHVPLTCDNPLPPPPPPPGKKRHVEDTEQVTVTVTNSSGTGTYITSANAVTEGPG